MSGEKGLLAIKGVELNVRNEGVTPWESEFRLIPVESDDSLPLGPPSVTCAFLIVHHYTRPFTTSSLAEAGYIEYTQQRL